MGLIQFAKTVGRKLGIGDDSHQQPHQQAPAQAQGTSPQQVQQVHDHQKELALIKLVKDMGLNVDGLAIHAKGDHVTVVGSARTQEEREKVVLLVGNTQGTAAVDDQMNVAQPSPEAAFYEVKSGDTLSKISKQFYGDANKYQQIFEANQPMLKDADEIYPGQRLRIPNAVTAGVHA
jgi:nucleoid-associated protein YgaU